MNERCEGIHLFLGFECAFLDARHVEEVTNQSIQAISLAFNRLCEAPPGFLVPLDIFLQE